MPFWISRAPPSPLSLSPLPLTLAFEHPLCHSKNQETVKRRGRDLLSNPSWKEEHLKDSGCYLTAVLCCAAPLLYHMMGDGGRQAGQQEAEHSALCYRTTGVNEGVCGDSDRMPAAHLSDRGQGPGQTVLCHW